MRWTPIFGQFLSCNKRWNSCAAARETLPRSRAAAAAGQSPDRDAQFQIIAGLIEDYQQAGNPCFSVDTKAKEFQGQLF
ncbi:MAG: hypothetical protein IT427_14740, partial [Pirellulales bacterium]|nr:hypothetical protein [Pirellulales bacterium]